MPETRGSHQVRIDGREIRMKKEEKLRLDQLVFELGLAGSRSAARAMIMAGSVLVGGEVHDKAGHKVPRSAEITIKDPPRYVSRGGGKLEAALTELGMEPEEKVCMDVGASTGGFTDLLLQNGAKKVYAVDVGSGLLDWKLRNDPRVVVLEKTNARTIGPDIVPDEIELCVVDVSFISLTLVLPAIKTVMAENSRIVALVKPQFEAGKDKVGKGGVVRETEVIKECVDKISSFAATLGFVENGRTPSPVKGPKGNQEYLLSLVRQK